MAMPRVSSPLGLCIYPVPTNQDADRLHMNGYHWDHDIVEEEDEDDGEEEDHIEMRELSDSEEDYYDLRTYSGVKSCVYGWKRLMSSVLGGGTFADVALCRNKTASIIILIWVTSIWFLVEWRGFNLLPLICYSLSCASIMLAFRSEISFLYFKLCGCFKRGRDGNVGSEPPTLSEASLSENPTTHIRKIVRYAFKEISMAFQSSSLEPHLYNFVVVNAALWMVSIFGSQFDFVTILYVAFLIVYTSLAIYGTYEEHIDTAIVNILFSIHRHYLVLNSTLFRTIRRFYFARMKLR